MNCPITNLEIAKKCPIKSCMWYSKKADHCCIKVSSSSISVEDWAFYKGTSVTEVKRDASVSLEKLSHFLLYYKYLTENCSFYQGEFGLVLIELSRGVEICNNPLFNPLPYLYSACNKSKWAKYVEDSNNSYWKGRKIWDFLYLTKRQYNALHKESLIKL